MFKSLRVYRGAEIAANTDHRLVIAAVSLHPFRAPKLPKSMRLDVAALKSDSSLADRYNIAVSNAFGDLDELPDDVEDAWHQLTEQFCPQQKQLYPSRCHGDVRD